MCACALVAANRTVSATTLSDYATRRSRRRPHATWVHIDPLSLRRVRRIPSPLRLLLSPLLPRGLSRVKPLETKVSPVRLLPWLLPAHGTVFHVPVSEARLW